MTEHINGDESFYNLNDLSNGSLEDVEDKMFEQIDSRGD